MESGAQEQEQDIVEAVEEEAQKRELPVGTVDGILKEAPKDIVTMWVDVEEWGCKVKIKTLTAAERARIRQVGIQPGSPTAWGEMEIQQFLAAVVEPAFNEHQVRKLHQNSGTGFQKVIGEHDVMSMMSKEELRALEGQFPDSE